MSAPIPLNSGCCAPPCPSNPQTAVPGPPGENAFAFTTAPFTQPLVAANVTVPLTHDGWVVPGQTVFIQGGGSYQVVAVSGLSMTVTNTGTTGNSTPGNVVAAGSQVSPAGIGGFSGNAYTTTNGNFTQPNVGSNVNVPVVTSAWAVVGETVYIQTAGWYTVFSVPDATHMTLTNLGYPGNAAPTTLINNPQGVTPSGIRGATGAVGAGSLNGISPTTTKGDLIVDNGVNSPLASDVRIGVGADGKVLAADSAQPSGIVWNTVQPNTVVTDGDIAIFSGTSGKPTPLKDSKMLITADGALQSTPSGGNARGSKAVDLQVDRSANIQVASGVDSVIAGGAANTASGDYSGVGGGNTNAALATYDYVAGGFQNTASGGACAVVGGTQNQARGVDAVVVGGTVNLSVNGGDCVTGGANNTAQGGYSVVSGGNGNIANGIYATVMGGITNRATGKASCVPGGQGAIAGLFGEVSHGGSNFSVAGDAQANELIWSNATTDATAGVELFLDGTAATQRAVLPINTTWSFHIYLVGRSSAGVCAVWECKGGIQNNAGTVTLVAAVTQVVVVDGTGGSWGVTANFAVTADNTNKSLKLAVTGAAATNIRWVAHARQVQVTF